jgi:hypothetical protein
MRWFGWLGVVEALLGLGALLQAAASASGFGRPRGTALPAGAIAAVGYVWVTAGMRWHGSTVPVLLLGGIPGLLRNRRLRTG